MARIQRDVEELKTVIEFLERTYGYKVGLREYLHLEAAKGSFGEPGCLPAVETAGSKTQSTLTTFPRCPSSLSSSYFHTPPTVVGHSKGALASFQYLCQVTDPPKFYVNLSGRYDMKRANGEWA